MSVWLSFFSFVFYCKKVKKQPSDNKVDAATLEQCFLCLRQVLGGVAVKEAAEKFGLIQGHQGSVQTTLLNHIQGRLSAPRRGGILPEAVGPPQKNT